MAEFSGKIVSAQFIDNEYSIIKVVYDDNGTLTVYNVTVNSEHPDYQDLVAEGWTQEKLIEETAEIKRAQQAAFNLEVQNAAKVMLGMVELQSQKNDLEKAIEEQQRVLQERDQALQEREKTLLDLDQDVKKKAESAQHIVWDHVMKINEDKDELFKFKLWALEQDIVKEASKEVKSSIRKAKRITTALGIIDSLI